jgi:pilus assembly protein CpaE
MADTTRILIASRSTGVLERLQQALAGARNCSVAAKLIVNGHADPLDGLPKLPDILVLAVAGAATAELEAQAERDPSRRCPLIVVSAAPNPALMRVAMQAGARDFLCEPVDAGDLLAAVDRIAAERRPRADGDAEHARSVVFMNASGGAGATFLATSIAHLLQVSSHRNTVLVDLDLQFAPVSHYLDLHPKRDLVEALSVAAGLDEIALEGYLTAHGSGLRVLSATPSATALDRDAAGVQMRTLHKLLAERFEHLVFDLPNQIDPPGIVALQHASDVAIVLQQSLPSLRNAVRLLGLLVDELAVPRERVTIVINRYRKGADVSQDDIERSLPNLKVACIPNHYQSVSESIAMGVPIFDHSRTSPVVRPLQELEQSLGGLGAVQPRGLFAKTLTSLMRN